jgi:hypothetical protein
VAIGSQQALLQLAVGVLEGRGISRQWYQLLKDVHRQLTQHLVVALDHLGVLKLRLHALEPGLRLLDNKVREAAVVLQTGRCNTEAVHVEGRGIRIQAGQQRVLSSRPSLL